MAEQLSDEDIVGFAKQFYETELRESLEAEHRDEFVTIEPVSRTYYLGDTFSEAVQRAKRARPGACRTHCELDTAPLCILGESMNERHR